MQSLTLEKISKAYAGVPALSEVTLQLAPGCVHALMGENGAGKSTLIKLIAGVVKADSLQVIKDGKLLPLSGPDDAHNAGFRFIHQELDIVPQVSVAENIQLGRQYPRRFGAAVDWTRLRQSAQAALDFLGATHIDVKAYAASLPAGDRMLIKIAAALIHDEDAVADLYVFDEPTAALSNVESNRLFRVIERLKQQGAAILYVSHRLDEVLQISDEVSVLRDGKHVSSCPVSNTSKARIIHDMTGRDVRDAYPPRTTATGDTLVVTVKGSTQHLSNLDFALVEGQILGVCGLLEAGQTRVLQLFLGLEGMEHGAALLNGEPLPADPAEAWSRNIAYIPRERRTESLMLNMSIRANIVLPHLHEQGFTTSKRVEAEKARVMADKVRLKSAGMEQPVGQLSGGNQQKVVFARALSGKPALLLLDEPTRGVDVAAKYDIYRLVRDLSARGCTVIVSSSDLPELLGMCDQLLVLQEGRQTHLLESCELSSADLLACFYSPARSHNPVQVSA